MCLAIPGKVLIIEGTKAIIDYGGGTSRQADISLIDPAVGDYVIVHAGFAIQILDPKEAADTLRLFRELVEADHA